MTDVLFEKRADGTALITLNRPESLNAMGGNLIPLLAGHLVDCERDPEVRCVAITGAGRAFCAGGDVRNMQARNDGMTDSSGQPPQTAEFLEASVADLRRRQNDVSLKLHTMAKPTVAIVNGVAAGAGMSVALACDLRVMSSQARLVTSFRNVGLSGDFGGTYYLQRLIGMGRAREHYFTAEPIGAARALELGIANRVFEPDVLMEEALAFCAKIASGPTASMGRMKANLNLAETHPLNEVLDHEALMQRISGLGQDSREAVKAFLEKREPRFTGR